MNSTAGQVPLHVPLAGNAKSDAVRGVHHVGNFIVE